MSQSSAVSVNPQLSSSFDRARRVSRIVAVLLAIGFWATLAWLIALPALLIWPVGGGWGNIAGVTVDPAALSVGHRAGAMFAILLGTAPSLLILHHGARAFVQFANGEVFVTTAIAHIRSAGFWLIIAGFATAVEQVLFNLFAAVLSEHAGAVPFALVCLAIAMSAVSLYYYLQVLKRAYVMPAADKSPIRVHPVTMTVLLGIAAAVVLLGCFPAVLVRWIDRF